MAGELRNADTISRLYDFVCLAADVAATLPALHAKQAGKRVLVVDTGDIYTLQPDGVTWTRTTVGPGSSASNIIGKVSIDQTTPGTTNLVAVTSQPFDVATTITRPANTTAYSAGDVLGGALDLGVLGPSAKAVAILGAQLEADITAVPSGQTTFNLYLYSVTPPSAVADNGVFDIPAGDRASFLGKITLGSLTDEGSTLYGEWNNINKQVLLTGTHLFGYLVTVGGFTPAANSEVYKLTLHCVGA